VWCEKCLCCPLPWTNDKDRPSSSNCRVVALRTVILFDPIQAFKFMSICEKPNYRVVLHLLVPKKEPSWTRFLCSILVNDLCVDLVQIWFVVCMDTTHKLIKDAWQLFWKKIVFWILWEHIRAVSDKYGYSYINLLGFTWSSYGRRADPTRIQYGLKSTYNNISRTN
jgi:hypothetical protein